MAGVAGFEPTILESEASALPLGDTPKKFTPKPWRKINYLLFSSSTLTVSVLQAVSSEFLNTKNL